MMLLIELFSECAGVGIITKQNTTPDVKPGEVQRQAKKLGMKIDRKGRPPLLHKTAAKNTSANKAYNLGLSEDQPEIHDESEIKETIRKIGDNKWRLYSKHGGRNLGTFGSLEAAKKHEREVQYFKHAG